MLKEIFIFIIQTLAITGLYLIVEYKRPYELSILNWSSQEKLIAFCVAVVCVLILKIQS
jgi:hypothetical protein